MAGLMDVPGIGPYLGAQQAVSAQQAQRLHQAIGLLGLQGQMEDRDLNRQIMPLKLAQLKAQVDEQNRLNNILSQYQAARGGGAAASPESVATATSPDIPLPAGPTNERAGLLSAPGGAAGASQGGGIGLPPGVEMALLHPRLQALGREQAKQYEPRAVSEGGGVWVPGRGFVAVRPKIGEGMQATGYGPTGELQGVQAIPGYTNSRAAIVGAEEGAKQGAQAASDLVMVDVMDGQGRSIGKRQMRRSDALGLVSPQATSAPVPVAPVGAAGANPLQAALRIPQEVQAGRDAEARRLQVAETQPGGGGLIPSGAVLGTPPEAQQAGARATATERAEGGVKFEQSILDGGRAARENLTRLQIIAPNIDRLPTGPLYPTLVNLKSYLNQLGISADPNLGPAQATDAMLKQMALKMRDPAGGGGMPGALSDADREFLTRTIPGLATSPQGNRQLIRILTTIEQRKIDEASIVNRMQSAGMGTNEIRDALAQFANSRPIARMLQ